MSKIRKADIILVVFFLAAALALLGYQRLTRREGGRAAVSVDGEEIGSWPLEEDAEIPIETERGRNLLVISGGSASVTEADCPDRICVRQGKIRYTGETIVCLPHRLTVTVTGGEKTELDGVAK